jgi:hypothetical protein
MGQLDRLQHLCNTVHHWRHCWFCSRVGWSDGIKWADNDDSRFPPYAGVMPILGWFVAPILTAIGSMLIFAIIHFLVLRCENGLKLSYYMLPLASILTAGINMCFVLTKVSSAQRSCIHIYKCVHWLYSHMCTAAAAQLIVCIHNNYTHCLYSLKHDMPLHCTATHTQGANKTTKRSENKA